MIQKLTLENFKNFQDATWSLGPFSTLIGVNASGKSNLKDALRFLHGISRGYTLADIFGEKYGEGGELQWRGIRGGVREITYQNEPFFSMDVTFKGMDRFVQSSGTYAISVELNNNRPPRVRSERLIVDDHVIFDVGEFKSIQHGSPLLELDFQDSNTQATLRPDRPILPLIKDVLLAKQKDRRAEAEQDDDASAARQMAIHAQGEALAAISSMRFLDFEPVAMRTPSLPGQTVLGDRGENLSTVLQAIVEDPVRRQALMEWVNELTPMDAADFEFPVYADGKTLLTLVEKNGQRISALSASDGTLRFLAFMAAMLGPDPAEFYFFEELENGIHPTRLHLLIEMIEQQTAAHKFQVAATTHSPQLLRMLSPQSFNGASLVYRLSEQSSANIRRLADLPEGAQKVMQQKDVARLYESGWFENTMSFLSDEGAA